MGLPPEIAKILVLQTAKGAALLAVERDKFGESPSELRRKVTSPGGTTEAALKVFAAKNFSQLITDALTAARDRSKELSAVSLFDDYCLDGAFVGCLLNRVLELGRNLFGLYLCHFRPHFKNLRAGIAAQPAGRAGILNSNFHTCLPYPVLMIQLIYILLAFQTQYCSSKNYGNYSDNLLYCTVPE